MNLLKKIFIVLVILIAIPLVVALFMEKEMSVEREIVIDQPKKVVFKYVRFLKNQDEFATWSKMDPNMKQEYKGTDGEVGFVSMWESQDKKVGKGEQEITNIVEGERIDTVLRFKTPFESTDTGYMITEEVGKKQTRVKWGYKGKNNYPKNIMNPTMKKMLAKDFDEGLANLKTILEKK